MRDNFVSGLLPINSQLPPWLSSLLWLFYFLWVLIRKVEAFIAVAVLLSVGGCRSKRLSLLLVVLLSVGGCWSERLSLLLVVLLSVGGCWSERLRSSLLWLFYFLWVGVDLKGWVYCSLFYFLWVGVDPKGWGVHCCGCFTFCGCVLIRKVEEFIAVVVLLSVGGCRSKRLSLLLVVLLSFGVCWSERLRSSLLWLTPSCSCSLVRRKWQTATTTAPSTSWLTSRKSCM